MKNNKIDSEILDDNYFPKEEKNSSSPFSIFLKIIGYTIFNSFIFISLIILFAGFVFPKLFSFYFGGSGLEKLLFIFLLASTPFLIHLFRQKKKNLFDENWKIFVSIFTFAAFLVISFMFVLFHIFKSGF